MADFQNGTPERSTKEKRKREREASGDDHKPMTRSRTPAGATVEPKTVVAAQPPVASPAAATHSVGPQAISKKDVYKYVLEVKQTFIGEAEKYAEFVKLMLDYKAQRVDQAASIKRLKDLIEGHVNLMVGINIILPEDCMQNHCASGGTGPVEDPVMDNEITSPVEVPAPVPRNCNAQNL